MNARPATKANQPAVAAAEAPDPNITDNADQNGSRNNLQAAP